MNLTRRVRTSFFAVLIALAFSAVASAATSEFRVLIDVDNNASTGCTVDGMHGVEQVVITSVVTNETAGTTEFVRQRVCNAGTLGAAVDVEPAGWPAGFQPSSGNLLVESRIPYSSIGDPLPSGMRLGLAVQMGGVTSEFLTLANGDAIIFPLPHRRRAVGAGGTAVRVITLDGVGTDWNGLAPSVTGTSGAGSSNVHVLKAFAYGDGTHLYFRFDANLAAGEPEANDDSYSVRQGGTIGVAVPGVLANDTDPSGADLAAELVTNPAHASAFTLNANGSFTYTNDGSPAPSDSFKYKATNGALDSNPATVTIAVTPNHAPVGLADSYPVPFGGAINIAAPGVLANDSDADGDSLTVSLVTGPTHSSAFTLNADGSFNYTHDGSGATSDTFTYNVTDGQTTSGPITVTLSVGANSIPVATNDSYTVAEGGVLTVPAPGVMSNDSDADAGTTLTATLVGNAAHGNVVLNADGSFTYSNDGSENASDSFTYTVSDGIASSSTATVNITITPVNDAPVATNDSYNTDEDTPLVIAAPGVLGNDGDVDGGALSAQIVANPTSGTVTLNADGSFTYTPDPDVNGIDAFTYRAFDGTDVSSTATVTITINAVNDPPTLVAGGNVTVNEDSGAYSAPWASSISAGPADESGQTLTLAITNNTNAALFSVQPALANDGTLSFTPAANANGSAVITYTLSDGIDTAGPFTFTIFVSAVNDVPSFTAGTNQNVAEDAGPQTVAGWATGLSTGPANESAQTLTFEITNNTNPTLFSAGPAVSSNGTLTYTPAPDANGSATITIRVRDDGGTANGGVDVSATQVFTINVTAVNDPPTFTPGGTVTVNEDSGAYNAPWATAVSAGPANEGQTATFAITNNSAPALFSVQPALASNGTLTFTPAANANGTATITYTLTDGTATVGPFTFDIVITAVNDAPVAVADSYSTNEDTQLNIAAPGVLGNDTDVEGSSLTAILVTNASNGVVALNANGSFSYTPNANFFGSDSFTYKANDGGLDSNTVTVTITVNPINDAPVAVADSFSTNEDTPLNVTAPGVLSNDSDIDSATITAVLVSGPSSASSFTLNADGSFSYTPNANFNGSDSFTYKANDGSLDSNVVTVNITVNAVNDAPVAVADSYTTDEDTPLTVPATGVLANDTDTEGSALNAVLVTNVSNGTLTLNADGSFTYSPNPNFNGSDSFTYKANDGSLDSNVVTVNITINAVNDAPVAVADSFSTNEDTPLNAAAPGVLSNDSDVEGSSITAILVSGPSNASAFTLNADGSFSYTPNANFNGSDSFTYKANDGSLDSNTVTVNLTINAVNDAPVAVADNFSTNEDTPLVVAAAGVLGNDTDTEGSSLNAVLVSGPSNASAFTLNADGSFSYTPNANFNGSDSFTYKANDGSLDSNTVTVSLTINAINDAPVAVADGFSTNEDTPLNVTAPGVLSNDSDVEGSSITAILVSGPSNASAFTLNADGSFSYTPNANFNGSDSFTYKANDGSLDSNTVTVTLTINAVNDAPVATADSHSTNEDTPLVVAAPGVLGNDSDVDGDSLNAVLVTGPANASAFTLNADGSFSYTPNANYSGADSFTYKANDGSLDSNTVTVNITVNAINDAPVAVADSYATDEETPLSVVAAGVLSNDSDVDGPAITAVLVTGPSNASSFTLNADGSFSYTPNADFSGSDSFTYKANDGSLDSNVVTVTITVNGVNDAPVITRPANASTNEDNPFNFSGASLISISDVDAASGSLSLTLSVANGTLTLAGTTGLTVSGDGTASITASGTLANLNTALNGLIYAPAADYSGSDTLSIGINDNGNSGSGGAMTDSQSVSISVVAANDAPVLSLPGGQTIGEDATLTFSSGNSNAITVADVDAAAGIVSINLTTASGTITVGSLVGLNSNSGNGTGNVTITGTIAALNAALEGTVFTPTADFAGAASIDVLADDNGNTGAGGAQTDSGSIAVTVNAVNDAPVITRPANASTNEDTPATFAGTISIADSDAGSGNLALTLGVSNGTLTLAGTTGLTVSGDGTASITASGTLTDLNAALNGLVYSPASNYNGADTLTIGINDNGNTGTGGSLTDSQSVAITVNAIDDSPVAVADSYSTDEDTPLTVAAASGVLANDTDVDTAAASLSAVLVTGPSNASAFTLNADGSFSYTPVADFSGSDSFTYKTNDGNSDSNTVTVLLTINAIDDAPVITRPATATTNEDTLFAFTGTISIADVDAAAGNLSLTLGVSNGTLALSGTTGLTVSGDGTASITASGSLADLNTALNGLSYTPAADYSGADTLTIGINDNGNTGTGGPLSDSQSVAITVNNVNDAPVLTVAGSPTFNEGGAAVTIATGVNITDVDDTNIESAKVTITNVQTGDVLNYSTMLGISGVYTAGTGQLALTGSATKADYIAALQSITFSNSSDTPDATQRSLSWTVNDGDVDSNTQNTTVDVVAVNDAPAITRPATATTNEDTPFVFNGGNVISVADPDAQGGSETVTLGVSNGALVLNGTTGLTVSGDGTNAVTLSGTLTDINNALNGLTYSPMADFNGSDTLTIAIDDNGNSGSGGSATDSKSVAITVNAVNDAPLATADSYTTDEDTPLTTTAATGVLANDTDVDTAHASLTAVLVTGPANAASFTLNADGSFSYTPNANFSGSDSFTYKANDGSLDSNTVAVSLTITAVDDAPVNSIPSSPTMPQDTFITMSGANAIQVSDIDAGGNQIQVSLVATNGTMTLDGTTGLTFTTGTGTNDATLVFTGTIANINAALDGMTFTSTPAFFGTATIGVTTDDLGFTGTGGPQTDSDTLNITVQQVNQPPVNVTPAPQTVAEDGTLTFSSGNSNAISTSDPDAGAASVQITVAVTNGVANLVPTAGVTINNNGTATVTATGSITDLNTALNGMTYVPAANYNGAATLTFTTNDQGNTGPGGAKSDTDIINITVTAVNDGPSITRPATVTPTEDVLFTFNGANTISVADIDAASGNVTVTLSVTSGVLTLSGTTGLSVTGNGTASISATGTLTDINNALNGMTYLGNLNFNGGDTLNIGVNDNGNTGTGGSLADAKSTTITVSAVNDAPVNTVPGTQTFDEDTTLTFSTGNGNALSISDVDAASGNLTVTLSTTAGTITLGGTASLAVTGNGTGNVQLVGTITNINAGLQGTTFTPTLNLNGAQTISMVTNDGGNTGSGGAQSDTDPINLSITAVNDAPTISNPANFSINEDTATPITTISVADVDANPGSVKITLDMAHGKIALSTVAGLTFVDATANNSASLHFTGTVASVNAAMNGMTYTPTLDFNNTRGSESLVMTVNDQGNTGTGGALGANATMPISIAAVNDAPVAKAKSVTAQAHMKITYQINLANDGSGDVSDADIGDVGYTPTFTLASVNVVGCPTCVVSNVNSATGTFDFEPAPGSTAAVTLHYMVSDNGNPGPGLTSLNGNITVTVNGPVIWFVDGVNGNDATGNGTLFRPYKTLTNVAPNDAAGHRIFLYGGSTYSAPAAFALNNDEWIIGQGITTAFDTYFGITPPANTIARPSTSGTNANVNIRVTVKTSDKLDGIDMDGSVAQIDNYTTGTFPTGTPTAATSLTVNLGRLRRTGNGNVIAIGGTGNTGSFVMKSVSAVGGGGTSTNRGVVINSFTGPFTNLATDSGVSPNGGTISGFGGNGMEFTTVTNGASTAVTLAKMTINANGTSQSVAGSNGNCGGDLVGGDVTSCVGNLFFSGVSKTSLDTLTITNSGQMGITAKNVTDFTLNNSNVNNNGNEAAENGLTVLNVLGTASTLNLTDTNFKDNANRAMYIEHRSGTPVVQIKKVSAASMIVGNTAHFGAGSTGAQGILIGTDGTAALALTVDGLTVQNNVSNGVQINAQATSGVTGAIQNCSFNVNAAGVAVTLNNSATMGTSNASPFLIQNNTGFTGNSIQAINLSNAVGATGAMFVKVNNNTIGTATAGSTCDLAFPGGAVTNCDGIDVKRFGAANFAVTLSNNTIKSFGGAGINLTLNQSGNSAIKVSGNNISNPYNDPGVTSPNAIYGSFGPSVGGNVCLDISGNTISAGEATLGWAWNTSGAAIEMYSKNSSVVSIAGYSGGNSTANVQAYIPTVNTMATPNGGGTKVFASSATGGSWANGVSCSTP